MWLWVWLFFFPIVFCYFVLDYEKIRKKGTEELVEVQDVEISGRATKPATYLYTLRGTRQYRLHVGKKVEVGREIWVLVTPIKEHVAYEVILGRKADSLFMLVYKNSSIIALIAFVLVIFFWIYSLCKLVRRIRVF